MGEEDFMLRGERSAEGVQGRDDGHSRSAAVQLTGRRRRAL